MLRSTLHVDLWGYVKAALGKSLAQYIKGAFIEGLFAAKVYDPTSHYVTDAVIEKITFSSFSPASWDITISVNAINYPGYTASINYFFDTSFDAYNACKNVANAFGPAVQSLLGKVVKDPHFSSLSE